MSILFAARYPERVAALILAAASARWPTAPDYPCGERTEEMASALEDLAARRWGQGDSIEWYAPSLAGSDARAGPWRAGSGWPPARAPSCGCCG